MTNIFENMLKNYRILSIILFTKSSIILRDIARLQQQKQCNPSSFLEKAS